MSKGLALAVIFSLTVIDAGLKILALATLPGDETTNLSGFVDLALHKNPGIAFDISIPLNLVIPVSMLATLAFAWIAYRNWQTNNSLSLAATAVVCGALGNAVDRLINGFTTDYLIFFKLSAINLSDVLILLGILGVLWYGHHLPTKTRHN